MVEVDSAGICGTDLHIYLDEFETAPPATIGHEFAGRIVETGKNVQDWQPGERVTAGTYFSTRWSIADIAMEAVLEPLPRAPIHRLEARRCFCSLRRHPSEEFVSRPGRSRSRAAHPALTEPLACTIHGVLSVAKVQAGDNVVIAGPGPIGLLA